MTSKIKFRWLYLSTVSALPLVAWAQNNVEEEVVVRVLRSSIENAFAIKENASGIVDAIVAEELGKFPDASIADSLQRVPGVAIARGRGGDGRFVTVRGLGEEFNAVTYNGRLLATENIGREFSFDNIASELVAKAEVFKTSQAALGDGSIGGRVNVVSAKPLDKSGFNAAYSLAGLYDDLANDTGTRASAVVSSTFVDDSIGVLASLNYLRRDFRVDVAESINSFVGDLYRLRSGELVSTATIDNSRFAEFAGAEFVGTADYTSHSFATASEARERAGGTLALQFRPGETFKTTLDLLYTQFESPGEYFGAAFYPCAACIATTGGLRDVSVADNGVIEAYTYEDNPQANARFTEVDTETMQFGINADWQAADTLRLVADLAWSQAQGQRDNIGSGNGSGSFYVIGSPLYGQHRYDYRGGEVGNFIALTPGYNPDFYADRRAPTTQITFAERLAGEPPREYRGHFARDSVNLIEDTVVSLKIDAEYAFDAATALKFGIDYVDREKVNDFADNRDRWCSYFCGYARSLRGIDPAAYEAMFVELPHDDLFRGLDAEVPRLFPAFNRDGLRHLYAQLDNGDRRNDDEGNPLPLLPTNATGNPLDANGVPYTFDDDADPATPEVPYPALEEGYVLGGGGDVSDRVPQSALHDLSGASTEGALIANAGKLLGTIPRPDESYVIDETVFGAYLQLDFAGEIAGKPWQANAGVRIAHTQLTSSGANNQIVDIEIAAGADQNFIFSKDTPVSFDSSFTDVLPAFNLSLNLTDELVMRTAFAETISRATLNNLAPTQSVTSTNRGVESIVAGNPELRPTRANNVDLSLEYYGDGITASAALFYKDLSDTVSNAVRTEPVVIANDNPDPALSGSPFTRDFSVTRPANNDAAEITGLELAWSHLFDSGLGYQVNATLVDSRSENADGSTTDLENISDETFNVSGFYETDRFSLRLSYNFRGEYLREISGLDGRPETVDDYGQWDLTASVNVLDNLTLFVEGVNLSEENEFVYFDGKKNFLRYYEERGRRINVGLRGGF